MSEETEREDKRIAVWEAYASAAKERDRLLAENAALRRQVELWREKHATTFHQLLITTTERDAIDQDRDRLRTENERLRKIGCSACNELGAFCRDLADSFREQLQQPAACREPGREGGKS